MVARFSRGPTATIYFPLRRAIDHSLLANFDTLWYEGAPPQEVLLRLNGALIGSIAPGWNPERVGAYTFQVPGSIVKSGWNRLDFEASYATALSSLTAEQIAPVGPDTSGSRRRRGNGDHAEIRVRRACRAPVGV